VDILFVALRVHFNDTQISPNSAFPLEHAVEINQIEDMMKMMVAAQAHGYVAHHFEPYGARMLSHI
jgi:hypothetical protein